MIELNKIYNEDCRETMKRMPDGFVDLVVTSPPYNKAGHEGFIRKPHPKDSGAARNIEYDSDANNDFISEYQYQNEQIQILNEIYRVLKDGGSVAYNHKVRVRDYVCSFPTDWIQKTQLKIRQEIVWDRGSTPSLNNIRFYPTTEKIYWLFKGDKPKYFNSGCAIWKESWRINPDVGNDHPAPFPEQIARRCIVALSQPEEIVYDPFMGSGTTAIACIKEKCSFIGSEISKNYCDQANIRIKNLQSQKTLF